MIKKYCITSSGASRLGWATALGLLLSLLSCVDPLWGQNQREVRVVPAQAYALAFDPYNAGDFRNAAIAFREAARDGVRSTEGRWIDSICYHTMLGESFFHAGNLTEALSRYDAALKLALVHRDWMLRVEFPPVIEPSASTVRSRINWGVTSRKTAIGKIPDRMAILQGAVNNAQALRFGGPIALRRELFLVRADEINRCIALSLRRRLEIMGSACQYDPLTRDLVAAFTRRPAPANHWSQAWIDVHIGLSFASAGRDREAVSALQRSLLVGGKFDHTLTATALLELGKLAVKAKEYKPAATFYLEATFVAAAFGQYDVMREAFRGGTQVHMITNQRVIYPPLSPASAWAKKYGSLPLEAEIALLASENALQLGQTPAAGSLLGLAGGSMKRSDMNLGELGSRFQYQTAHLNFQKGNLSTGTSSLTAAITHQRTHSLWLFQLALVDGMYLSGRVNPRIAELLYDELLREPTAGDWINRPRETLTVLSTPHILPMEHWFKLALMRRKVDKALEIADRIRRHRFFGSLPAGGRLMALRWVLSAPADTLTDTAQLQRQALLAKFPKYAALAQQVEKLRGPLSNLPLVPEEKETQRKQLELFTQIAKISTTQELFLRDLALRREPSEFAFPPLRSTKQIQENLPEQTIALVFFSTAQEAYGFAVSKNKLSHWRIDKPAQLRTEVGEFLRQMGHFNSNSTLDAKRLQDDSWRQSARQVFESLTGKAKIKEWAQFKEMVVVPDGFLWYLPFEALQIPKLDAVDKNESDFLLSKLRVRYAPTAALILRDSRGRKPLAKTAVVAGKLFPRDDDELSIEAFARLRKSLPLAERLPDKLPVPSALFATACDRLVVFSDALKSSGGPYRYSPLQIDRNKQGSTLGNWFSLPWGKPEQVVLPGFHTAAESSLKDNSNGQDVFLTVCGLMGTGARSILLSRWRTGGQSTYDLTQKYVSELPHTSAADAWQRSVHLLMETEIEADMEPRVKESTLTEPVSASHPFFWAGYLLVDTAGEIPDDDRGEEK